MKILGRIPNRSDLFPVYGLIVMLVYGWSLYRFIHTLPGWLKFLTVGEIGSVFAYTLVTDLIESILILSSLVIVSMILPAKWFHDDFVLRGGISVLYLLIFIMIVANSSTSYDQLLSKYALRGVIDFSFLHFVLGEVRLLRKFIAGLADRSTIFLYLSIPSSVLALVIVLIRLF